MPTHVSADQSNGEITLRTGRQGVGSKVGHDLVLRVGTWSAKGMLDGDSLRALKVIARLSSLEVVRGDGGLKPLTDKDRRTIISNALEVLRAGQHPELVFEARDLSVGEGRSTVKGTATLAGRSAPLSLDLDVARTPSGARVTVHGELLQTAFGIKPYTGMMGALKVRDLVEVSAVVTVEEGIA